MANIFSEPYANFVSDSMQDLQSAKSLSNEEVVLQFGENTWSVIQVLNHLLTIERQVLIYMKKKTQDTQLHRASFRNWWKAKLTLLLLKMPIKFKAPPQVATLPNTGNVAELIEAFEKTRKETGHFIATLHLDLHNKLLFRHPRSGMMSLNQTIDFLHAHWLHHRAQLSVLKQHIAKKK